ncbi:MAG: hypothetical protein KC493_02745 [Bacteriovoracaceae bacterium]|nr:hypothetical protein [Bacteriovoracaceae bacterium]
MKTLLCAVAVFMSLSLNARDLTPKEQLVLLPLPKTMSVKNFMEKSIVVEDLSFKDYFAFQLLKKSCLPLELLLDTINKKEETFPDQASKIVTSYQICSEGSLGLGHLFVKQQD